MGGGFFCFLSGGGGKVRAGHGERQGEVVVVGRCREMSVEGGRGEGTGMEWGGGGIGVEERGERGEGAFLGAGGGHRGADVAHMRI